MFEERRRILNMLAEGKISAEDAERLLDAIDAKAGSAEEKTECCDKENPRYLRILVNPKSGSARHDRDAPDAGRSPNPMWVAALRQIRPAGARV